MKPRIHAAIDAKQFGGTPNDYLPIHQMMDSSKSCFADNRHRVALHHAFGIFLMEKIFGVDFVGLEKLRAKHGLSDDVIADILKWKQKCVENGTSIKNSDGSLVEVRDIAESHCVTDFRGFIPSLQDYIVEMSLTGWMLNGQGKPASFRKATNVGRPEEKT